MNLVEIDIVGLEALQALVELKQDLLAREAFSVWLIAHHALGFGGDYDGLAARVGLEEPADHRFAFAAGINVGGIEEVNAQIESLAQEGLAFGLVQRPGVAAGQRLSSSRAAIGHASKTNA